MLNETGARRGRSNPVRAIGWWAVLLTCVVGAVATAAAAPTTGETYRWHGELVALDEVAGTVTLQAPVVAPAGLEAAGGMRVGEPIVIAWSGFESPASGIGALIRDDGSDLEADGSLGRQRVPGPSAAGDVRGVR